MITEPVWPAPMAVDEVDRKCSATG